MDEKKVLDLILGVSFEKGRMSTLQLALKQARYLIGYDEIKGVTKSGYYCRKLNIRNECGQIKTDLIEDNRPEEVADVCDAFSALALYLIVLDQLGCLFNSKKKDLNIRDFLKQLDIQPFRGESYQTTDDIYRSVASLRNSLCHSFGLVVNRKEGFRFVLDFSDSESAIKLPERHWDGDWNDKSIETQTTIYVFPFCNAIEETIKTAIKKYENNELQCNLKAIELLSCFTILI